MRIKTPAAFVNELTEKEIEVLPLVDDYDKPWRAGWCTYANYFDKNPDVEYLCGGVNQKTPTAAGCSRAGSSGPSRVTRGLLLDENGVRVPMGAFG